MEIFENSSKINKYIFDIKQKLEGKFGFCDVNRNKFNVKFFYGKTLADSKSVTIAYSTLEYSMRIKKMPSSIVKLMSDKLKK